MRRTLRRWMVGLGVLILLVSAAGCQRASEKSERASADWSRGIKLGQAAINSPVGMTVGAAGEVYLAWVGEDRAQGGEFLQWVHLDGAGRVVARNRLPIEIVNATQVELAPAAEGTLHLTWLDRRTKGAFLYHARLDASGTVLAPPRAISLADAAAHSYALAQRGDGSLDIFWGAKEGAAPGLYHLLLSPTGEVQEENRPLERLGFDPNCRFDATGTLHLVWHEETGLERFHIYYATFDPVRRVLVNPTPLVSYALGIGLVEHRPSLGLAGQEVYIFWSRERRGGGLSQPTAEAYYLTFPAGQPERAGSPRQVNIPANNHPAYIPVSEVPPLTQWATVPAASLPAQFIYMACAGPSAGPNLFTAFAVELVGRTKSIVQVVTTVWREGELQGYQVSGKTRSSSLRPNLLADPQGHLHLAWLDTAGFGAYDVFYASTSPAVRAELNRITGRDVANAFFDFLWGVAQAASFLPIVFAWVFVPLILVALYLFIRVEGDLARRGPRWMLVVSILLYIATKYLFRSNWMAALPLPPNLAPALADAFLYATPLVISAVAGLLTWFFIKRREYTSLFMAFLVYVACDAALTLLIYVPGILAE